MDEEHGNDGHPVAFGLLTALSVVTVRYYAREYLIRTEGIRSATRFFHRADRRLGLGIAWFAVLIITALSTSYASLTLSYWIVAAAVATAVALIAPSGIRMVSYANQEMGFRFRQINDRIIRTVAAHAAKDRPVA